MKSPVAHFVAERWVSWLIELTVLAIVAYFTISETRKTAEQTRMMLAKYDAAISQYAAEKAEAVDSTAAAAIDAVQEKAGSITKEDVIRLLEALKEEKKKEE